MKTRLPFLLFVFPIAILVLSRGASSDVRKIEDGEAGAAKLEQLIELEHKVHFLTPTGEDTVVHPGAYLVEAGDGALRLIPDDDQQSQPITIQAQTTTHEESLAVASPVSTKIGEDKHVIALLLMEGKAMQAVGSYSGVSARGAKKKRERRFMGKRIFVKPRINGILTTPKFGVLQENQLVVIKGSHFGSWKTRVKAKRNIYIKRQGKVLLHGYFKEGTRKVASLKIDEWTNSKIKATVEADALRGPLRDQKVKVQIVTANGPSSSYWRIPLRASRTSIWLNYNDRGVKVLRCSKEGNKNLCNGKPPTGEGLVGTAPFIRPCFWVDEPKTWKRRKPTILGEHANCHEAVDWDEGSDQYEIQLANGWVFREIWIREEPSSKKDWVMMPGYGTIKKEVLGTSVWRPKIKWKVSPDDQIRYYYWVKIEGPQGIPHYCQAKSCQ